MQQRHCRINRPVGQFGVLESDTHVLSVEGEGKNSSIHVEEHTQDSLFLEFFAIGRTGGVRIVSQLAKA